MPLPPVKPAPVAPHADAFASPEQKAVRLAKVRAGQAKRKDLKAASSLAYKASKGR